jgi:hypothetical protein
MVEFVERPGRKTWPFFWLWKEVPALREVEDVGDREHAKPATDRQLIMDKVPRLA